VADTVADNKTLEKPAQVPIIKPVEPWYGSSRKELVNLTPQRLFSIFENASKILADQQVLAQVMEDSDQHISGTLQLRRNVVLKMSKNLLAGEPGNKKSELARDIAEKFIFAPFWKRVEEHLLRATLPGYSALGLLYDKINGLDMPTDWYSVPNNRFYVLDSGQIVFYTTDTYSGDYVEPTPGNIVLHQYNTIVDQPGLYAPVRQIATLFFTNKVAEKSWTSHIEGWFQPVVSMSIADGTDKAALDTALTNLQNWIADKIIVAPPNSAFKIDPPVTITPHMDWSEHYRRSISVNLLGQDTSQMAQSGSGTLAATAHEKVRMDIQMADAELLDSTINQQILEPWTAWNFGPGIAAPVLSRQIPPSEDDTATLISVYNQVFDRGIPVKIDEYFKDLKLIAPDLKEFLSKKGIVKTNDEPILSTDILTNTSDVTPEELEKRNGLKEKLQQRNRIRGENTRT